MYLSEFAALAATAVSGAQRREQVWGRVLSELGALCRASRVEMVQLGSDSIEFVALWSADGEHEEPPSRWSMSQTTMSTQLARVRVPVRVDDWTCVEGDLAAIRERVPAAGSVLAPVFLDGNLWGAVVVDCPIGEILPPDTERRAAGFALGARHERGHSWPG
ncbi:hypothetical protein AB0A95_18480 [Micromonospora sp. NPDC049230]|uniref:hypothetical protein n=1 Tax=Micromonospora sp. NPDC049230 TaxID=3155502 RepID=UPI0033D1CD8D